MDRTRMVCLIGTLFLIGFILFPAAAHATETISPTSYNFGTINVNSTKEMSLSVTNSSASTITLESVTSSLPEFAIYGHVLPKLITANTTVVFSIIFKPVASVTYKDTITFTFASGQGPALVASLTGAGAPTTPQTTYLLSSSTSSLSFANQLVGTSASQSITVKNTGTGSVKISQVTTSGAGFSVSGLSGEPTLTAGQSLTLTAKFLPAVTGSVSGKITVTSSATDSPTTISLSGTGVQPQISVIPSSVNFGSVADGVANTQTITVKNSGTANLSVTQAALTGTGYTMSGMALPLSIAPNASAAFNVAFTPASAGSFSGNLSLVSNAPSSPLGVPLSGTGVAQVLQLSASSTSLSFGSITAGTSATQTITLTNKGNTSLNISQITESGSGFSISGAAVPITLAAGQSTSFSVLFAPTAAGTLAGSVTVTSNAANSPTVVALSGTGTSPVNYSVTLNWTPSSPSYQGFNIYRATISGGPYARVDTTMVSSTTYIDSSVTAGQTYYYVATELSSTGVESGYSSQVSVTIP